MIERLRQLFLSLSLFRLLSFVTWLSAGMLIIGILVYDGTPETGRLGRDAIRAFAVSVFLFQFLISRYRRYGRLKPANLWLDTGAWMLSLFFLLAWGGVPFQRWQLFLALAAYFVIRWQLRKERKTFEASSTEAMQ